MSDPTEDLIIAIARAGKESPKFPVLKEVIAFQHFFLSNGELDYSRLDDRDGLCTRRELLLRYLLLNAVIDQGPELEGVRQLLIGVTNDLYLNEIRFLHKPILFFQELGLAVDQILNRHASIKSIRAKIWAAENQTNPSKYNLFIDNTKQVLNYAVFRWGVPLALPLLLERDNKHEDNQPYVLLSYLESWDSAEKMSQQLKDHERYGLGKAIGDKACHLFAKWMVSSFKLSRRKELGWGEFSFEVPYDSNAGRVLWRTGFFLKWATEAEYIAAKVIQSGAGKGGNDYLRVTNIRGMHASSELTPELRAIYNDISINHLKSHHYPPHKVEIQRIQHAHLLTKFGSMKLGVADFDEGLIYIGTHYCFNHANPLCEGCPINHLCEGYQTNRSLIDDYRT